jgi:hypothetical protein
MRYPKPSKPSKGTRAIALANEGVGNHRYSLYARAWLRVQEAEREGFHLEAITLIESLLSDRLESRASYLTGINQGFRNLGALVRIFKEYELVTGFRDLVERIDMWRERRNTALDEMVKFESGHFPTWEEQTAALPSVVREGQGLLRRFAELDELERAKNNAEPPATSPNAFPELSKPRNSPLGRHGASPHAVSSDSED